MPLYLRPTRLADALDALAERPLVPLAGGTDVYPARVGGAVEDDILDVTAIGELRGIRETDDGGWRIGALATWRDILDAQLPPLLDGLQAAARTIGGVQVQERGTLAGNVCNASPAADGMPVLLTLDAAVELASRAGTRRVPVGEFVVGNRRTVRREDELVTALLVPDPGGAARAGFGKLGSRHSLVISIVAVAGVIVTGQDRRIQAARLGVGACSPVARRLPALEARLLGHEPKPSLGGLVTATDLASLAPIDDIRGSAAYRLEAAVVMLRRLLGELGR